MARMLTSYPSAWLLLGLPFISLVVILSVPRLRGLASTRNVITWPVGVLGLGCLLTGLLGFLSPGYGLPVMVGAGAVSGFSMLAVPQVDGNDGDDWRDPPDDPSPQPTDGEAVDWQLFDLLRSRWDGAPTRGRERPPDRA